METGIVVFVDEDAQRHHYIYHDAASDGPALETVLELQMNRGQINDTQASVVMSAWRSLRVKCRQKLLAAIASDLKARGVK